MGINLFFFVAYPRTKNPCSRNLALCGLGLCDGLLGRSDVRHVALRALGSLLSLGKGQYTLNHADSRNGTLTMWASNSATVCEIFFFREGKTFLVSSRARRYSS